MSKKRLSVDRQTTRAIRDRLVLLAFERPNIEKTEIRRALKGDDAILAFARRHEVSLDWLFLGGLTGLLFMAEWANNPGSYAAACSC